MRINLHTAGSSSMQYPAMDEPNALWVKEFTLKCKSTGANNRLSVASKQIKEMMKNVKTLEAASDMKASNGHSVSTALESLVTGKAGGQRREIIDGVVIRPNIEGRKSIGQLEIHNNGVRFTAHKGDKVDVCFSNIKHCFFQPCASDELIVLIHFHLKQQIMLGNKKV